MPGNQVSSRDSVIIALSGGVIVILGGIVLLLAYTLVRNSGLDRYTGVMLAFGTIVGIGGILIIWKAGRNSQDQNNHNSTDRNEHDQTP